MFTRMLLILEVLYMVKIFESLPFRNWMADDLVSWYAALVALIKIVQMMTFSFYGKVRFGQLVFCTGKKVKLDFLILL